MDSVQKDHAAALKYDFRAWKERAERAEATIKAARALLEEWRDEYGDYPQSKDDCADELQALLNRSNDNG